MSASGSTPHLHLSQYDTNDRPSYISDYTDDMGRIDTGFNLAQTNALTALNRVAALEQSIGSAGAVGQTAMLSNKSVDTGSVDGNVFVLGFELPLATLTRNAEPADVPWTWVKSGDSLIGNAAELAIADRGMYRVTVEANATYGSSPNISFADIRLTTGLGSRCVPLVYNGDRPYGRAYSATCSFVVPYDGEGGNLGIEFGTSFSDSTAPHDAQMQCDLTFDVEQLSTEYSVQLSPEPPIGQ
jgi:hypothetical protein